MNVFSELEHSRLVNISVGVLLSTLWVIFAYRHISSFFLTRNLVFLVFCFSETVQAFFFLFRTTPKTVSLEPFDWFVAIAGTFTILLFHPGGVVLWGGGEGLLICGVLMQVVELLSLNRSFAIVPARRKVKTEGLYSVVRHPMYASYIISFIGYILFNASVFNFLCLVIAVTFFIVRIAREEKHLMLDPAYSIYMKQVRWRLFPFVY
jgi:protein-S-isoprenylcysteine O-methyltransferase Ste14